MGLEPGQIVENKYRVTRLLGEGGMGAVYECENTSIQKRFAIKVLHASVADNKDAVGRFEKEAQAAGRIGSDHITEVVDLGTLPSGDRFMVMEFLDGSTLSGRIKEKNRLTPAEVAPIMVQLLEGLEAAHKAGIIHRDLKPDNVFLLRSKAGIKDFVKILDFGISKFNRMSGDAAMSMTRTGAVMGTPYYMSPEQAKGSKEIDSRSDLYSVGVILYEAVTGQVPFNADTFNELIFKIVLEAPPPPEQFVPDLDPAFGSIIRKAMSRDPSQRFVSATEFQEAVMQWMQGGNVKLFEESATSAAARGSLQSVHASPPSTQQGAVASHATTTADAPTVSTKKDTGLKIGIGVGVVALLGLGGFALTRGEPPAPPPPPTATAATAATSAPTATAPAASSAPTVQVVPPPAASSVAQIDPPPAASSAAKAGPAGKTDKVAAGTKTDDKKPPPGPAPAPAPGGGRKIRTGLD